MLHKLVDKDESKEEKDDGIDDKTKEMEINNNREVVETESEKLFVNVANKAPPPQDPPTTTTTTSATAE